MSIDITYISKSKISDEDGFTSCTVLFESTVALLEWEARAGGTGHGTGILVGSGGSLDANTEAEFVVSFDELILGDGDYTIYVYGRDNSGWL